MVLPTQSYPQDLGDGVPIQRRARLRILIISVRFDDQSLIGSIRPRNFAAWLATFGHDVTVITRSSSVGEHPQDPAGVSVLRVPLPSLLRLAFRQAMRGTTSPIENALDESAERGGLGQPARRGSDSVRVRLKRIYGSLNKALWVAAAAREAGALERPDLVFSTYGPLEPHFAGRWISASRALPWVADFRDSMILPDQGLIRRCGRTLLQTAVVRRADAVTCVSRGLADELDQQARGRTAVHIITNGFNPTNVSQLSEPEDSERVLHIAYTGKLYPNLSDAAALFQTLSALASDGLIDPDSVRVDYAGADGAKFREQAQRWGLGRLVVDHGFLSREDALRLQLRSDLLLVLSWNQVRRRGILTGKVYDYLATGRPILALTTGDLANAELTEMISTLGVGYAYEYAQSSAHERGLRDFLLNAYQRRCAGQRLETAANTEVERFHYERIVRGLETVFMDLVESGNSSDALRVSGRKSAE